MSTSGNGSVDLSSVAGAANTGDTQGFTGDLGNVDPSSGYNSLGAGLMGAGAGTLPNGYTNANSNYNPDPSQVGVGTLNGNTQFQMPTDSAGQLNAQALSKALAAGGKVAGSGGGPTGQQRTAGAGGHISLHPVTFGGPIQNFAGSAGGSQLGQGLLQLLSKYRPGQP